MAFQINGNNYLTIDTSDLEEKLDLMRLVLKQKQFEQIMYRTFRETGKKAKSLVAKEVQDDYAVTQGWVKSGIGQYKLSFGGEFPVTCTIPLTGTKGMIGPTFKMSQPSKYYGRKVKGVLKRPKAPKIYARIVKGQTSALPATMQRQGGNPPFIAKGMVFTRRTSKSKPIVRVVALGVPQMPLNRSGPDIQDALLEQVSSRLDHHFERMLSGKW